MAVHGGVIITPDNQGPAAVLAIFISLVVMIVGVLLKVASKISKRHGLQSEDYGFLVAMCFAIAYAIVQSRSVPAGLGRHMDTLSNAQLEAYQKTTYASLLLYVSTVSASKVASICFIFTFSVFPKHHIVAASVLAATGVWTMIALFGAAFQCTGAPDGYWAIFSSQCFNEAAFWQAVEALSIALELAISGAMCFCICTLKMPALKKAVLCTVFSLRLLSIAIIITRIVYLSRAFHGTDRTYDDVRTVITTQVLVNATILLGCAPFLRTFVQHLQPGMIRGDLRYGHLSDGSGLHAKYAQRGTFPNRPSGMGSHASKSAEARGEPPRRSASSRKSKYLGRSAASPQPRQSHEMDVRLHATDKTPHEDELDRCSPETGTTDQRAADASGEKLNDLSQ